MINEKRCLAVILTYLQCKLQDMHIFTELTCPGDCSNAGDCNTSTGQCTCIAGRHGSDCSSKYIYCSVKVMILYRLFPNYPFPLFRV